MSEHRTVFYIPHSRCESVHKENDLRYVFDLFTNQRSMTREAIAKEASKMSDTRDFLALLNKVKMSELGDRGHPFTMPQLNYFINPKRNRDNYRTFTIPKKSGGVRTISAPVKMLKSMLTYTNRILQAFYEAPECVTGFVPSRSVVDNAERHVGRRYVFNADLKDFFPSIPQARVWGALKCRPFNFNDTVASAIAGLCCIEDTYTAEDGGVGVRNCLPQGSPCSPVLTNIVCHNLDWKLGGLARRFRVRYSRYADDITFSGDADVFGENGDFMTEFRRIVAEQRFTLNEKKTRLQRRGGRQEVTGLVVNDRVNVAREYVRDLDNLLYIWERHGYDAAFAKFYSRYTPKQDYGKKVPDMEGVVQGRLMYLRMVKGEDSPVWRRLQKRFNRLADRADSSSGADVAYLHSYSIAAFEKAVGTTVELWDPDPGTPTPEYLRMIEDLKESGATGLPSPDEYVASRDIFRSPRPLFVLNGIEHGVRTSKYVRTRLQHLMEAGMKPEDVARFKEKYRICYCTHDTPADGASVVTDRNCFWMLTRPHVARHAKEVTDLDGIIVLTGEGPAPAHKTGPKRQAVELEYNLGDGPHKVVIPPPAEMPGPECRAILEEDGKPPVEGTFAEVMTMLESGRTGLSTDETLDALVRSDFDLNTLDRWEKTRKDN